MKQEILYTKYKLTKAEVDSMCKEHHILPKNLERHLDAQPEPLRYLMCIVAANSVLNSQKGKDEQ